MLLLGGRCEFMEKYFETVRDCHARGFAVASMDWRGQGLSARALKDARKGHIEDFHQYKADLSLFMDRIVAERLPPPYILMAHSMGGAPVLQLLADGDARFAAAVLSAPMTRIAATGGAALARAARLIADGAKNLGFGAAALPGQEPGSFVFDGNALTSDRARHRRFADLQTAAPEAVVAAPTFAWVAAALAACDDLHRPGRFGALNTPVLIVSAERDRLVQSEAHARLADENPLIHRVEIKGALHELLMERDEIRAAFWRAADGFLAKHLNSEEPLNEA